MPSRINGQVEFPGAEEEGHGGRRAGRGENRWIFVVFFNEHSSASMLQ